MRVDLPICRQKKTGFFMRILDLIDAGCDIVSNLAPAKGFLIRIFDQLIGEDSL
jgi:hypothetical protein